MNVVGKISLGLTALLALHLAGRAEGAALASHQGPAAVATVDNSADVSSDNPYGTIMARNIFGLVPIPPPLPPPAPPEDPPPKITANGIMNVFGDLEALFKVSLPAKGSTPAKDQSYMLSQGQRQDDIEVVKIDEPNGTITFDNHGTTQEIALVPTGKNSGSGPATGGGGSQPSGFNPGGSGGFRGPAPGGGFTGGGPSSFPTPGQGNPGFGNNNAGNPQIAAGGSSQPSATPQNQSDLTMEQQAVLIEAERERLLQMQQGGQTPEYDPRLLPPTSLTLPPPPGGGEETK